MRAKATEHSAKRVRVEVHWIDACSDREGWHTMTAQHAQPLRQEIYTVGYLLRRTDEYIQVAQSMDKENHMSAERITIPAGCVLHVRTF